MAFRKDAKLYNYVVNTLGISKGMIMEYVEARLEQLVVKSLEGKLSSKHVEQLILNRITAILQEGFQRHYSWEGQKFDDYVKKTISNLLMAKLNQEYSIDVKAVKKDALIIQKVEK